MEKPSFSWSLEETRAYKTAWRLERSPFAQGVVGFRFMNAPHGLSQFCHSSGVVLSYHQGAKSSSGFLSGFLTEAVIFPSFLLAATAPLCDLRGPKRPTDERSRTRWQP